MQRYQPLSTSTEPLLEPAVNHSLLLQVPSEKVFGPHKSAPFPQSHQVFGALGVMNHDYECWRSFEHLYALWSNGDVFLDQQPTIVHMVVSWNWEPQNLFVYCLKLHSLILLMKTFSHLGSGKKSINSLEIIAIGWFGVTMGRLSRHQQVIFAASPAFKPSRCGAARIKPRCGTASAFPHAVADRGPLVQANLSGLWLVDPTVWTMNNA